jgi:hypothetical protein
LLQADHYRLRAFFEGVAFVDDRPLETFDERIARERLTERIDQDLERLESERSALLESLRSTRRAVPTMPEGDATAAATTDAPIADGQSGEMPEKTEEPSDDELIAAADPATRERFAAFDAERSRLESLRPRFETAMMMSESDEPIGPTFVLYQGDHQAPREEVAPGFPSLWDPAAAEILKAPAGSTSGRRSTLADWIIRPDHPWTWRVAANRVWQGFFGRGLVGTPNDFGFSGEPPTHPELLDQLALDLVDGDGSLKRLRRRIVTSAVYRQVGSRVDSDAERRRQEIAWERDPEGRLYWRYPGRRLTAEQLRDAMLVGVDALDSRRGGPAIWPELPAEILQGESGVSGRQRREDQGLVSLADRAPTSAQSVLGPEADGADSVSRDVRSSRERHELRDARGIDRSSTGLHAPERRSDRRSVGAGRPQIRRGATGRSRSDRARKLSPAAAARAE